MSPPVAAGTQVAGEGAHQRHEHHRGEPPHAQREQGPQPGRLVTEDGEGGDAEHREGQRAGAEAQLVRRARRHRPVQPERGKRGGAEDDRAHHQVEELGARHPGAGEVGREAETDRDEQRRRVREDQRHGGGERAALDLQTGEPGVLPRREREVRLGVAAELQLLEQRARDRPLGGRAHRDEDAADLPSPLLLHLEGDAHVLRLHVAVADEDLADLVAALLASSVIERGSRRLRGAARRRRRRRRRHRHVHRGRHRPRTRRRSCPGSRDGGNGRQRARAVRRKLQERHGRHVAHHAAARERGDHLHLGVARRFLRRTRRRLVSAERRGRLRHQGGGVVVRGVRRRAHATGVLALRAARFGRLLFGFAHGTRRRISRGSALSGAGREARGHESSPRRRGR